MPDGGNQDAHRTGNDTFAHVVRGHHRDGGEPEEAQPKTFRPAELEREPRQRAAKAEQEQRAHNAPEGRGQKRRVQPEIRPPLLAQRPAVECGRHGGRRARRADENGRVRAAIDGPSVYRAEHDQAAGRVHGERGRDHERHPHGGGEPRKRPDDDPACEARDHQDDVQRLKQVESGRQNEFCHAKRPFEAVQPSAPLGERKHYFWSSPAAERAS